ncbi:MAG: hypothetical protein WD793_02235 [Steroidobacteraceae bacterium]
MEFERELIPLAKLRLNKENDRHGPLPSEHEAIEWLLTHHSEHMVNIAENIAAHGLSPIESILVLPAGDESPGDYIVWEGNRRVAALKLLDDSNRCHDAKLKRKFTEIRADAKVPIGEAVECTIAPSAEEADRLIELRHQGPQEGVGTVSWDARQKERHQQRLGKQGRYAFSHQVINAVANKLDPSLKAKIQENGFAISTLDRILKNTHAREFLGLSTEGGAPLRLIEEKETLKGLSRILRDVADGMSVKKVYGSVQIREYLDTFEKKETPDRKKTIATPAPLTTPGGSTGVKPAVRSRPVSHSRKRLIPASVTYSIKNSRVNAIYLELRKLDVGASRNAVAVLFRVFLELSVELYLDELGITYPPNDKLRNKADKVVKDMLNKNWIDRKRSKGIATAIGSKNDLHAVDTFHAYVHNYRYHPSPDNLNTAFDNLQPFFDALFKNLP